MMIIIFYKHSVVIGAPAQNFVSDISPCPRRIDADIWYTLAGRSPPICFVGSVHALAQVAVQLLISSARRVCNSCCSCCCCCRYDRNGKSWNLR